MSRDHPEYLAAINSKASTRKSQGPCLQLPLEFFLCGIPNGTGAIRVKDLEFFAGKGGESHHGEWRLLVILGLVIGPRFVDVLQLGSVQWSFVVHQDMVTTGKTWKVQHIYVSCFSMDEVILQKVWLDENIFSNKLNKATWQCLWHYKLHCLGMSNHLPFSVTFSCAYVLKLLPPRDQRPAAWSTLHQWWCAIPRTVHNQLQVEWSLSEQVFMLVSSYWTLDSIYDQIINLIARWFATAS